MSVDGHHCRKLSHFSNLLNCCTSNGRQSVVNTIIFLLIQYFKMNRFGLLSHNNCMPVMMGVITNRMEQITVTDSNNLYMCTMGNFSFKKEKKNSPHFFTTLFTHTQCVLLSLSLLAGQNETRYEMWKWNIRGSHWLLHIILCCTQMNTGAGEAVWISNERN